MKTLFILLALLITTPVFAASATTKVFINIFECEDKSIVKVTEFSNKQKSWNQFQIVKKGKSGIIVGTELMAELTCHRI